MKDLKGKKIGPYKVLKFSHRKKSGSRFRNFWECKCDCGRITIKREDSIMKERKGCEICKNTNKETPKDYILNRIKKDKNGCWIWQKATDKDGYGFGTKNKYIYRAHRFSYETFVGKIPKGMLVCHHCDTPACCNFQHLFLGSFKDNNQDASKKGRLKGKGKGEPRFIGSKHPRAKTNELDVLKIRVMHRNFKKSVKEISEFFGLSHYIIEDIVYNKSWKHVAMYKGALHDQT